MTAAGNWSTFSPKYGKTGFAGFAKRLWLFIRNSMPSETCQSRHANAYNKTKIER